MRYCITTTRTLKGFPLVYRGWHQEVEAPYRRAEPCLIVRIPGRRAIVLGRWRETGYSEQDALTLGLGIHEEQLLDEAGRLRECFEKDRHVQA